MHGGGGRAWQGDSDSESDEDITDCVIHSAAISTSPSYRSSSYRLFIRPILLNNILVKAHWDFGCNVSLIPAALLPHFDPQPQIEPSRTRIQSAVGASLTLGKITLDLKLSDTCFTTASFMIVDNLHMVLLGGDILGVIFKACYSSEQSMMTLINNYGRPENIFLDYPLPFSQHLDVIDVSIKCSCDEHGCTCSRVYVHDFARSSRIC